MLGIKYIYEKANDALAYNSTSANIMPTYNSTSANIMPLRRRHWGTNSDTLD